jgi:hypothetical protein
VLSIPPKRSSGWSTVTAGLFVVLLILLTASRLLSGLETDGRSLIGFAILASIAALAAGAGGFLGGKIYFVVVTFSYAMGILYMLYILLTQASGGWSDITSVISFMTIALIGIISGLVVQIVWSLARKRQSDGK